MDFTAKQVRGFTGDLCIINSKKMSDTNRGVRVLVTGGSGFIAVHCIIKLLEYNGEWSPMRNFFFERLCAAEFHWFFVQGVDCMFNEFYVPAVSSFLNGIEASLRITISQIQNPQNEFVELTPYKVLSNNLISDAKELGMPVEALAFPNENDFFLKLQSQKPNLTSVEVVRYRNNICHGNILEFVNTELGRENSFFTPVSLRILCFELLNVSGLWAEKLGSFRKSNKISHYDRS